MEQTNSQGLTPDTLQKFYIEELKFIQEAIKRFALNSFQIKGWAITLVVVSLLLKSSENPLLAQCQGFIAIIPLILFWFLDAYFLKQERMYRKLYKWVVENRLKEEKNLFSMDASEYEKHVQSVFRTMFSITLVTFYGIIFILIALYGIILHHIHI